MLPIPKLSIVFLPSTSLTAIMFYKCMRWKHICCLGVEPPFVLLVSSKRITRPCHMFKFPRFLAAGFSLWDPDHFAFGCNHERSDKKFTVPFRGRNNLLSSFQQVFNGYKKSFSCCFYSFFTSLNCAAAYNIFYQFYKRTIINPGRFSVSSLL